MTKLAEKIHGYALEDLSLGGKPFNTLMERLKSEKALYWLQCSFYPFKNKNKPRFHVIDGIPQLKENQMLVILLRASDNSMNHVVTIYKNWIFDSCENQALPLCKARRARCLHQGERKRRVLFYWICEWPTYHLDKTVQKNAHT